MPIALALFAFVLAVAAPAQGAPGSWDRAWGEDVIQTGMAGDLGTVFEICTVISSCQVGGTTPPALGGEFDSPIGVATDSSGNVYVADQSHDRIQKFGPSGNFLLTWGKDVDGVLAGTGLEVCTVAANCKTGEPGAPGGEMENPTGVATDSSGNVYVTDKVNLRIQKFSSTGVWERAWGKDVVQTGGTGDTVGGLLEICTVATECQGGMIGGLGGEMNSPDGIATDSSGNVYLADRSNHRVQKFEPDGDFLLAWGEDVDTGGGMGAEICTMATNCKIGITMAPALGGELSGPSGVGTDSVNNVYVADKGHNRLQKFDSSGNFLRAWGKDVASAGPGDTGLGFEICVAGVDTCQSALASTGLGGEMNGPFHVDTDGAGNVYVAEREGNRVSMFASSGVWQRAWGRNVNGGGLFGICTVAANCLAGTSGTYGGEMDSTNGIAADAAGNVYVADNSNHRIQKFVDPPPPPAGSGSTPTVIPTTPTTAPKRCKKGQKLKKGKCVKKKRKRRR